MKFNSEMRLAIEHGEKVVTRRLLEPPPPYDYGDDGIDVLWATGELECPYGAVGDKFRVGATTQEITSISVQRLQDITEEDAKAEGIDFIPGYERPSGNSLYSAPQCGNRPPYYETQARVAFMWLWDSIYKKSGHGWDKNDWVWVIDFKTVREDGK